jgi:hypothetical protein
MMITLHLLARLCGPLIVAVYLFKYTAMAGVVLLILRRLLRRVRRARAYLWLLLGLGVVLDALIIAGVGSDPFFPM